MHLSFLPPNALLLISLLLTGCEKADSTLAKCPQRPTPVAVVFGSVDEATTALLNSEDARERAAATEYLRAKNGDEMTVHYGKMLFQISHAPARAKVYQALGLHGGTHNAQVLYHYIQFEPRVELKAEIACALANTGAAPEGARELLQRLAADYQLHHDLTIGGRTIEIDSQLLRWRVRADSMPPPQFKSILDDAIAKLKPFSASTNAAANTTSSQPKSAIVQPRQSSDQDKLRAKIKGAGPERFLAWIAELSANASGTKIDAQSEILGASAVGMNIVFQTRLINLEKAELGDIAERRRVTASRSSRAVCTSPTAALLIGEFGAKYRYTFYSKSYEYLFEYTLDRETCKAEYRW